MRDDIHLNLDLDTTPPGPGEYAVVAELTDLSGRDWRGAVVLWQFRVYPPDAGGTGWTVREMAAGRPFLSTVRPSWEVACQAAIAQAFLQTREQLGLLLGHAAEG